MVEIVICGPPAYVSPIVVGEGYLAFASATRDGKYIVYTRNKGKDEFSLRVRNQASGDDRELTPSLATATPFAAGDESTRVVTPATVVRVTQPPTPSRTTSAE